MNDELIIGDNSHGFNNEKLIINALNNKKFVNLNPHLKKFVKTICEDHNVPISNNTLIESKKADKETDPITNKKINAKPDLYITINKKQTFGISTKMGSGNSVHQEKIESFLEWLNKNKDILIDDPSIFDDFRLLIWGDGTLNGSAPIKRDAQGIVIGRYSTKEFKSLYPDKWKKIQLFLNKNKIELIKRALFFGKTHKEVHYIYHGTDNQGTWISQKELLKLNIEKPLDSSTFNIGRMSFQIYNADKKGTPSGEKKRGEIQFKYGKLANDLQLLMLNSNENKGSFEGDLEEFNLSKLLNKNKNHSFWKFLSEKLNLNKTKNYYVVKVVGQKYSKNANKKVMCKTDNYLIETLTPIDKKYLLKNEYLLTESDLPNLNYYKKISESGISVKQKDSKNYTITKMTLPNFYSAFKDYLDDINFYIQALVLYCDKKQVNKNKNIAKDLKVNELAFCEFFNKKYNIEINGIYDYSSLTKITKLVKEEIKQIIETNYNLKEGIFKGKGWFDSPYYINFMYSHGKLTDEVFSSYHIDNGSGRSKGIYTLIIKPNN